MSVCSSALAGPEDPYVREARRYLLAGQADDGLKYANQALSINPNSVDALVKRAEGYCLLEKFDLAIADCNKALSIKPDGFEAIYRKGCALCGEKKFAEAKTALDAAIRLQPQRGLPYLYRGTAKQELHQYAAALQDFHQYQSNAKSTSEVSSRPIGFMSAIKCTRAMKRTDLEMKELDAWVASDPQSPDAHRLRGQLLHSQSRSNDAKKEFESALRLDPTDDRSKQLLKGLQESIDSRPR